MCPAKVKVTMWGVLAAIIAIFLSSGASSYQVGALIVEFSKETGLPDSLARGSWQLIRASENELLFKIMTLEPVVRRYEFITHEVISVSYRPGREALADKENMDYPLPRKGILTNLLGLMFQKFLQEGFEIGEGSCFIKTAGQQAYKFELIRSQLSTEQLLRGDLPIKYAWHIVVWKKGWYLITYFNFDNPFPGPHFSDFKMLLPDLRFVDENENESKG